MSEQDAPSEYLDAVLSILKTRAAGRIFKASANHRGGLALKLVLRRSADQSRGAVLKHDRAWVMLKF
jgi:hypothetical protein